MTGEIIAHSQDQTDQKQTDRDRTRAAPSVARSQRQCAARS